MTKNQRDSLIAVGMVAAFIAAAVRAAVLNKSRHAPAAEPAAAVSSVETQLLEDAQFIGSVRASQQVLEAQAGRWDQEWERDPFRAERVTSGVGGVENLVLKGIFWDDERPRAIVNDKMLRVGEVIDGYQIMEIRPSSVLLWTGEKNLELKLFHSPEEPPPAAT